jgi:hypothetical protein
MMRGRALFILVACTSALVCARPSPAAPLASEQPAAGDATQAGPPSLARELREGFRYRIETLAYGSFLDLKQSRLNPKNLFGLPRYQAEFDLRPDFGLELRRLRLDLRPRYELRRSWFEDGRKKGTHRDGDSLYVNEWLARLRVGEGFFVSYGRENLQWGPSYLVSPSNPFQRGNGQNNPFAELPGFDLARATWIPDTRWSVSAIANTGEGRLQSAGNFERRYAVKTDYTGQGKYASLVLSMQKKEQTLRAGGFAGWSASDAILLHAEGSVADEIDCAAFLLGGVYTFRPGSFVVLEYFHDGEGCGDGAIWDCYRSRGTGFGASDLLIRRNYAMAQFTHPRLFERALLTALWIHDLDDGSDRAIMIYEHELGAAFRLFGVAGLDRGRDSDEFGSIATMAGMAGVRWVR